MTFSPLPASGPKQHQVAASPARSACPNSFSNFSQTVSSIDSGNRASQASQAILDRFSHSVSMLHPDTKVRLHSCQRLCLNPAPTWGKNPRGRYDPSDLTAPQAVKDGDAARVLGPQKGETIDEPGPVCLHGATPRVLLLAFGYDGPKRWALRVHPWCLHHVRPCEPLLQIWLAVLRLYRLPVLLLRRSQSCLHSVAAQRRIPAWHQHLRQRLTLTQRLDVFGQGHLPVPHLRLQIRKTAAEEAQSKFGPKGL